MLTLKAFHIILVVSWFAGLFYLPRIYVNLAAVTDTQSAEYQRLLGMARRLYKFVTPIGLGAVVLGLWLWFGYGFAGGWLHLKTLLVIGLIGYHLYCGKLMRDFAGAGVPYTLEKSERLELVDGGTLAHAMAGRRPMAG